MRRSRIGFVLLSFLLFLPATSCRTSPKVVDVSQISPETVPEGAHVRVFKTDGEEITLRSVRVDSLTLSGVMDITYGVDTTVAIPLDQIRWLEEEHVSGKKTFYVFGGSFLLLTVVLPILGVLTLILLLSSG